MNKQTLRWISRIMAVILLLVTLPLPEFKVNAAEEYGIWIGSEQFTSDHLEILDGKGGKATYDHEKKLITFDNFNGTKVYEETNGGRYLLYVGDGPLTDDPIITLTGKASFSSSFSNVMGIASNIDIFDVQIDQNADISITTGNSAVWLPRGVLEVKGKLTANLVLQSDEETAAIYADSVIVDNVGSLDVTLKNKNAAADGGKCSGIRCKNSIENNGRLNIMQSADDGPVSSGLYVENTDPEITAISLDGDVNIYVYGEHSVAIGNEDGKCGNVTIGGKVAAYGGLYAFFIDHGLRVVPYLEEPPYIKEPEDGIISSDGKTVFNAEGDIAPFVVFQAPEHYGIWVGETEVTAGNRKDIPGVVGGKASYDPQTSTLKFEGDVTGVSGVHNNALIETTGALNIEGNAKLENTEAAVGIRLSDDMTGMLTIYGELEIGVKNSGIQASKKDLVINGKLKVSAGTDALDYPVNCRNLRVNEDAVLEAENGGNNLYGIFVNGSAVIEGGSLSVSGASLAALIVTNGDMTINNGRLEALNTADKGLSGIQVGGKFTVKDSNVNSSNAGNSTSSSGIFCNSDIFSDNSIIAAGSPAIGIRSNGGLYAADSGIYAAGTAAKGITCKYIEMSSGKLEAEGGEQAIDSVDGFDLKTGVDIAEPSGGKISGRTIVEADGSTPAKHVLIDGGTYYRVWVDGRQVSDKNADDIFPDNDKIDVCYDALHKTLIFKGDSTLKNVCFDADLNSACIYADQDLTINGKVNISDELSPKYGIYVKGDNTLTLAEAQIALPFAHPEAAISVAAGKLNVFESRIDANAAIVAGKMNLDGSCISLKDMGQVKDAVLEVYGDVHEDNGSLIEVNSVKDNGWGVNISGALSVYSDSSMVIDKSGNSGFALSVQDELDLDGGSVEIRGSGNEVYGLDQTEIYIDGGSLDIELTGRDCIAADCSGKDIGIFDGKLNAIANGSGSRGIVADKMKLDGGRVSIESYGTALEAEILQMKSGKLSAESTKDNGQAILLQNNGFELSDEVGIIEPEDGDIDMPGTTVIKKDGSVASKVVLAAERHYDTEEAIWNLFASPSAEFDIAALSSSGEIENTNAKSAKYYDAKLKGSTITVSIKNGADRKKAVKAANSVLEFNLGEGGTVEYALPVVYAKPKLKLTTSSALIKKGVDNRIDTEILYRTDYGTYETFALFGATIKYGDVPVSPVGYGGKIEFKLSDAVKGAKLSIMREGWDCSVELKFTVKTTTKDILSANMDVGKALLLNKNLIDQVYMGGMLLNGQNVPASSLEIIKGSEVAEIDSSGRLIVRAQSDTKPGNYTVTVRHKDSKAVFNAKVKLSDKALDKSIGLKVVHKYDVVTGDAMVLSMVFKDAKFNIYGFDVECDRAIADAGMDPFGNLYVFFKQGNGLNAKNLNIGNMKFILHYAGGDIVINLKNVKAQKTTPKLRTAAVNIYTEAGGAVKGSVNIVSSYTGTSGRTWLLIPGDVKLSNAKGAEFEVNILDRTEINIKSLSGKSGSVKVTMVFDGGIEKSVKIRVKKAKK